MPAELDYFVNADGQRQAAFLAVGAGGWHGEGVVVPVDELLTVDDVLAKSGTGYTVETRELFTPIHDDVNGEKIVTGYKKVPGYRATVRTDRDAVLGCVGSRYTPLQNRDALKILQPLIDQGVAKIETAGALRNGRDVWYMTKWALPDTPGGDVLRELGVENYTLITNNHGGQRNVVLKPTPIRVVCANTLGAALGAGAGFQVPHTASVEATLVKAAQDMLANVIARFDKLGEQYKLLRATYLDEALFRELVLDVVAPRHLKFGKAETKREQTAIEKVEQKRELVTSLWTSGAGHVGDLSAWEAYNGAVEAIDHSDLWRTRGRLAALYDGQLAQTKQTVLNTLVAHATDVEMPAIDAVLDGDEEQQTRTGRQRIAGRFPFPPPRWSRYAHEKPPAGFHAGRCRCRVVLDAEIRSRRSRLVPCRHDRRERRRRADRDARDRARIRRAALARATEAEEGTGAAIAAGRTA